MQVMPETTKESMRAGPVRSCAATPVSTKMPVPMIAPTPKAESWTGPRMRRRRLSLRSSSSSIACGFLWKSWLGIGLFYARTRAADSEREAMIRFEHHDHYPAAHLFQHFHDHRVVRPPEISQRAA